MAEMIFCSEIVLAASRFYSLLPSEKRRVMGSGEGKLNPGAGTTQKRRTRVSLAGILSESHVADLS